MAVSFVCYTRQTHLLTDLDTLHSFISLHTCLQVLMYCLAIVTLTAFHLNFFIMNKRSHSWFKNNLFVFY